MSTRWIRFAGICFSCGVPLLAAAQTPSQQLSSSPASLVASGSAANGLYISQPITISVMAAANWSLSVSMSVNGTVIPKSDFTLVRNAVVPPPAGVSFSSSPVSLSSTSTIASGTPFPAMKQLCQFTINAQFPDPSVVPAGSYTGTILFTLTAPGKGTSNLGLAYTVTCQKYLSMSIGNTFQFAGAQVPATYFTKSDANCTVARVSTNDTGTMAITFGALTGPAAYVIASSRTALSFSAVSASDALAKVTAAAFGTNTISISLTPGTNVPYYIVGKAQTVAADVAGSYTGTLAATATGS